MKKALKVILIILSITAILFGCFILLLVGSYERVNSDINKYSDDIRQTANAAVYMPDLKTLTGYTDIEYTHKFHCYSIFMGFCSDGLALFVSYDEDQYKTIKNEALSNYTFLQDPIYGSGGTYELPVTEFEYKGYTMKVVPDEEYSDFCACKSFMLLGYNDEECKIAYLYYYDFDIDCIAKVGDDLEKEICELVDAGFSWVN